MGKEKHSLSSSIIEISSKDDVSKEITMLVHKIDMANGNGLDFKMEHSEKYKDTLINKPVVAKYYPLKDDLGDHEAVFDSNGNIIGLETIAIGTIKETYIDDFQINSETTVKALYAKADLWNYKYPEIVSCVEKLFNDGNADSSVEVEIYTYGENPNKQYRYPTDYSYLSNCLLGSTVIPADSNAGVVSISQREIAMAVKKDLENIDKKGDVNVSTTKELFNKGFAIKSHLETSELSFDDIYQQIYNLINPVDPQTDQRDYEYWIRDIYQTYFICQDWDDDKLYKVSYSVSNDVVSILPNWQEVEITYQPVGSDLSTEVNNLQSQLDKAKEELQTMSETKTVEVQELETKVTELQSKIDELNGLLVSEKETKTTLETELNSKVTELQSEVDSLKGYKDQVEKAENDAKVAELNAKYSKLISEETYKSEEVQNAIAELNSQKLNEIVVAEIAKEKVVTETSTKTDDVTIIATKQEDLITKDKHEFWSAPRS